MQNFLECIVSVGNRTYKRQSFLIAIVSTNGCRMEHHHKKQEVQVDLGECTVPISFSFSHTLGKIFFHLIVPHQKPTSEYFACDRCVIWLGESQNPIPNSACSFALQNQFISCHFCQPFCYVSIPSDLHRRTKAVIYWPLKTPMSWHWYLGLGHCLSHEHPMTEHWFWFCLLCCPIQLSIKARKAAKDGSDAWMLPSM